MIWLLNAVFVAACAALGAAVVAIALLFVKRAALAHRIAKRATVMALFVIGIAVAEVQAVWTLPGRAAPLLVRSLPPGDPSARARVLAEAISEMMNCSALALMAAVLGVLGWFVSRTRLRRSAGADGVTRSRT